ncbi:MAG: hypothetical protein WAM30_09360 [Candidatus Dormiibacterota bacterium]
MAGSSDQLSTQIGELRDSMESSIVVLRDRGQRQLKRATRIAVIALAIGAAVGVAAVGAYVVYRVTRAPTRRERIERIVPLGWWDRLRSGVREQVPPMRLYVGDRQVGEDPPRPRFEKMAVRVAQTVGTAAGTALAAQLAQRLTRRGKQSPAA